jgi:hypothetical protein
LLKIGQSTANSARNKVSLAALADVCHVIFNSSESLTRK